jgi:hypothetical protein
MNKFFIAAGTAALDLSTAEARESLLQRLFKNLRFHGSARPKADPVVDIDPQLIDEEGWQPEKHQSPLYDLASSHPHVIAASLFSRKLR